MRIHDLRLIKQSRSFREEPVHLGAGGERDETPDRRLGVPKILVSQRHLDFADKDRRLEHLANQRVTNDALVRQETGRVGNVSELSCDVRRERPRI